MENTSVRERLPEDFCKSMESLLEEDEREAFFASYDKESWHALRFRNEAARDLLKESLCGEMVPWAPLSYYYDAGMLRPGLLPYHDMGLYYMQEPSAMGPAALLAPKPGERVLDLCAAPGGKTTELAYYMKNQGLLVANEIHPARAKILSSNVERLGITNALVLNEDSNKLRDAFLGFFTSILVDAPCSGEGMFRKNPDAIDEWSLENVKICAARQAEILDNAALMLAEGGRLVYSTCTFAKEENEDTIFGFLTRHPEFELVEEKRFWPHKQKGEGHFMALLQKKGELDLTPYPSAGKPLEKIWDKSLQKSLQNFLQETFAEDLETMFDAKSRGFTAFGDQLYLLPPQCPSLQGRKVMRAGLHLGTAKKDRFEPGHALALACDLTKTKKTFAFDEKESYAYLRGEGISGISLDKENTGWTVCTYDGFAMGWGKASGNQIKNHYPKGLRRS